MIYVVIFLRMLIRTIMQLTLPNSIIIQTFFYYILTNIKVSKFSATLIRKVKILIQNYRNMINQVNSIIGYHRKVRLILMGSTFKMIDQTILSIIMQILPIFLIFEQYRIKIIFSNSIIMFNLKGYKIKKTNLTMKKFKIEWKKKILSRLL